MSSINQKKNYIKLKPVTMDQMFAPEYFYIIFRYLPTNRDLYSCILVNRYWANCAIPILWEVPFKINNIYNLFPKVIQVYQKFIQTEKLHNDSLNNKPLYDYPSFLKELPFDRFLNSAIASNYSETLIIELIKILSKCSVKLRRFDLSQLHLSYNNSIIHKVLPQLLDYSSIFNRLSYLNCTYHLDVENAQVKKAQIFNALANSCHNIITIKATVWSKDEAIALSNLICSQKWLKKFSLVNSNESASFSVQSLQSQAGSLNNLTFKNMHRDINLNKSLNNRAKFKTTTFQLNGKAIDSLLQCNNITKIKFKHCEGLNRFPIKYNYTFPNLTTLEYIYGNYKIHDDVPPVEILSNIVKQNGKTIKNIIFDWHSYNSPECTQLIKNIAECTINLEHLKTPLYTLEQLALILQTQNQLKNLDINIGNGIKPYCALFLFINMPFNNLENSIIQICFDGYKYYRPEFNQLKQVFEQIFYKNYQINNFVLRQYYWPNLLNDQKKNLVKIFPSLNILIERSRNSRKSDILSDKYNELVEFFDGLLKIKSDNIWAMIQRGATYFNMNNYKKSLEDLNAFLKIDPNNACGLRQRGEIFYMMEKYEDSLVDLNRSLEIQPDNLWSLRLRGIIYCNIKISTKSWRILLHDEKI
ncbi:tetratricopeptide repeat protein [Gigaspora margarita]|uniref:Tetratricopeptide repeat protein n=1 Tax=Gigaspora margarita TaxID=4874 RepID=A0A8H4ENY0_GIGMA|nr:tetratricopeptide repeat protein [Gigaspora margarita]